MWLLMFAKAAPISDAGSPKSSAFYVPDSDISVRFDDPDMTIDWPINTQNAILSSKDAVAVSWPEFDSPFIYEGD